MFSATASTLPNGFVQWNVKPDVAGTVPKGQEREILIAKKGESVQRMMFAGGTSGKVVVQKEVSTKAAPGRAQARQIVIERFDTISGQKGNTLPLPNIYQLADVSPSGDYALVVCGKESGKFDRLDVVGLSPKKHIAAWRPFGGEADKKPDDPALRHFLGWSNDPKLVVWAKMIDDQHVLTINPAGKLVCWELPECKASYYFEDFGEPLGDERQQPLSGRLPPRRVPHLRFHDRAMRGRSGSPLPRHAGHPRRLPLRRRRAGRDHRRRTRPHARPLESGRWQAPAGGSHPRRNGRLGLRRSISSSTARGRESSIAAASS